MGQERPPHREGKAQKYTATLRSGFGVARLVALGHTLTACGVIEDTSPVGIPGPHDALITNMFGTVLAYASRHAVIAYASVTDGSATTFQEPFVTTIVNSAGEADFRLPEGPQASSWTWLGAGIRGILPSARYLDLRQSRSLVAFQEVLAYCRLEPDGGIVLFWHSPENTRL